MEVTTATRSIRRIIVTFDKVLSTVINFARGKHVRADPIPEVYADQ